mgnify:CR=1 FL=1
MSEQPEQIDRDPQSMRLDSICSWLRGKEAARLMFVVMREVKKDRCGGITEGLVERSSSFAGATSI